MKLQREESGAQGTAKRVKEKKKEKEKGRYLPGVRGGGSKYRGKGSNPVEVSGIARKHREAGNKISSRALALNKTYPDRRFFSLFVWGGAVMMMRLYRALRGYSCGTVATVVVGFSEDRMMDIITG